MTAWRKLSVFLIILVLQTTSTHGNLWSWFALDASTSSQSDPPHQPHCSIYRPTDLAKFDIESGNVLSNSRGKELVEKVRHQTAKHSCWHKAYSGLVSSCREILKEEEKKARLAMRLTNCFLQVSDRVPQQCPDSTPISKCTSGLSDHIHSIFLAFFIDAASMCHHLQYVKLLTCLLCWCFLHTLFFLLSNCVGYLVHLIVFIPKKKAASTLVVHHLEASFQSSKHVHLHKF